MEAEINVLTSDILCYKRSSMEKTKSQCGLEMDIKGILWYKGTNKTSLIIEEHDPICQHHSIRTTQSNN